MVPDYDKGIYSIKYEGVFDGPIDLLLELIRKKKIGIYDIRLSYIINGFTDHIRQAGGVLLDTMSRFVYFSSILLEIKSRSLLPSQKKAEEKGELDVNILKRRETEYRTYKKVSNYLNSRVQESALLFIREAPIEKNLINILPDFMEKLDPVQIWMTAGKLFSKNSLDMELVDVYNHRSTINIPPKRDREYKC